jgi:hypothetical protein
VTLDEARAILGVAHGASHAEIRDAFRHRARLVHPDAHPNASAGERDEFASEFDRAREARDILLLLPDATGAPSAPPTRPAAQPTRPSAPRAPARPSTHSPPPWRPPREPSHPHLRTLTFDEFVQVVDAAGFGEGHRSQPSRDFGRRLLWTTVGALSVGVLITVVWTALAL